MKTIRTITFGFDPDERAPAELTSAAQHLFTIAEELFATKGRTARTRRLLLPPLNARPRFSAPNLNSLLGWVKELGVQTGARWFNVPFTTFVDGPLEPTFEAAFEVIRRYPNAFVNFIVAENGRIQSRGATEAARFMLSASRLTANGYDNFRVGATCNGSPGGAFFPFAQHRGEPGFAVALELPQLFHQILDDCGPNLETAHDALLTALVAELTEVDRLCRAIEEESGVRYQGIDASLAPYPEARGSVGELLERLGVEEYGCNGTLAMTAFLTDILRRGVAMSEARSVGFNGVMDSMLEDPIIALRGRNKAYDIDSLLAFAAVCGCGLDMVPVPGDTLIEELASMIIDIAALSSALSKPLGVRLLPIPGRAANELTDFGHDFIYNCRILPVRNRALAARVLSAGIPAPSPLPR